MPFYLLQARGLSPAQAGLLLTAQPLLMAVVAPISGTPVGSDRHTPPERVGDGAVRRRPVPALPPGARHTPFSVVAAMLAVAGLGIGIFVSPNNSALMGAAPRHRQGIAAGILALARNVGMVIGVGLAGAVYTTVLGPGGAGEASAIVEAMRVSYLLATGLAVVGVGVAALRA